MKKILMMGKDTPEWKELTEMLSEYVSVKQCSFNLEVFRGMMRIVSPDLVIIDLADTDDIIGKIFFTLRKDYVSVPILVIGTDFQVSEYEKYMVTVQFEHLKVPVENEYIVKRCCERLEIFFKVKAFSLMDDESGEGRSRKHVLVVDDNAVVLRNMKSILDDRYSVAVATSVEQALQSMAKKKPDLIFLDYEMPVIDGRMAMQLLQAQPKYKDIPVIFLTAISNAKNVAEVLKYKPAGYILKPPVAKKILEVVSEIFEMNGNDESDDLI